MFCYNDFLDWFLYESIEYMYLILDKTGKPQVIAVVQLYCSHKLFYYVDARSHPCVYFFKLFQTTIFHKAVTSCDFL
jgi:hypothetical protein